MYNCRYARLPVKIFFIMNQALTYQSLTQLPVTFNTGIHQQFPLFVKLFRFFASLGNHIFFVFFWHFISFINRNLSLFVCCVLSQFNCSLCRSDSRLNVFGIAFARDSGAQKRNWGLVSETFPYYPSIAARCLLPLETFELLFRWLALKTVDNDNTVESRGERQDLHISDAFQSLLSSLSLLSLAQISTHLTMPPKSLMKYILSFLSSRSSSDLIRLFRHFVNIIKGSGYAIRCCINSDSFCKFGRYMAYPSFPLRDRHNSSSDSFSEHCLSNS